MKILNLEINNKNGDAILEVIVQIIFKISVIILFTKRIYRRREALRIFNQKFIMQSSF